MIFLFCADDRTPVFPEEVNLASSVSELMRCCGAVDGRLNAFTAEATRTLKEWVCQNLKVGLTGYT